MRPPRIFLAFALLASGCRERQTPEVSTEQPRESGALGPMDASSPPSADATVEASVDAGPEVDPIAAAVAALEDARVDAPIVGVDVAIVSVKVTPKDALPDPLGTLAQARWRFRACARFVELGDAAAPLTLVSIRVGEGGEATRASAPPGPLGDCLAKAARAVVFPEPDGGIAAADVTLRWTRNATTPVPGSTDSGN